MSDQQLIGLLEKYLQGNCTAAEKAALEAWYEGYRAAVPADGEPASPNLLAVYHDITGRLKKEGDWVETPVRTLAHRWWRIAAAVLVLVTAVGIWKYYPRPARQLALDTDEGIRKQATLADGTEVWMNVGSHLRYPANMDKSREVYLQGEAFFAVTKNDAQPFIIHTDDMQVQVLGTRFNVKAYTGDESLEATLVEGRIAIAHEEHMLNLAAGEKLTLRKKTASFQQPPGSRVLDWGDRIAIVEKMAVATDRDNTGELVWMDNKLAFKDKSFPELVRLMSRWYNRKIILTDTFPADYRFKGTFKKETVEEVLNALQITADFKYTVKGDSIFLHH
ncbi:DUF4974 domain-containing protein [Chitinophaga polysaccharea]|uniref:FecR family protein n=1 Tax=Chitinophaga polysaccharea TaxID=1293035 RepID=UPI0014553E64|nr:FecR domain-containing protein [Chitinophaga polysaccharea]NLR58686.1 DUF4974 domain-containing protein [Chitinophaga polysaccharea]